MEPTKRRTPTRRKVNAHPAPHLAEAVTVSRFWRSVSIGGPDECWPWLGDTTHGYGVFFYVGRLRPAHELALSFTTGEARAEGFETCHSCDNPPCCNPAHLRFDTRLANVDDMWDRDRAAVGERAPNARLTASHVRAIRERRAQGAIQKHLAEQYGLSAAYVSEIVNGLVWQDAGGPINGRSKRTQRYASSRRGKAA